MGLCPATVKRSRAGTVSAVPLAATQPCLVARVQLRRVQRAVVMYERCQRATGSFEANRHVAVSFRIGRKLARREQLVESPRWLDRIEPVALIDGSALDDRPAAVSSHQPIEKARVGRHVGEHAADLLAHQDGDTGLRERAIVCKPHAGGKNLMFRTLAGLEAVPAVGDKLAKAAAKPGDRNLTLRHEGCE